MFRPLTMIIAAILLASPGMSRQQATSYAQVLQQEAKEHHFDPFTGVAIIQRESRWHQGAISADGEDYGLAQIRARYIGACRSDPDPVNAPSEACQAVKRSLLNGTQSIRVMASLITRNRELCKEKTGTARFGQWLASYEGRNYPGRNKWCQPAEGTQEVIRYQQWLVSKLAPARRSATARASGSKRADDKNRGKRRVKPATKGGAKPGARKQSSQRESTPRHR